MEENNENNINSENDNNVNTEEVKTEEIKEPKENRHVCFENHCWKKCLASVLAAFLGGFLAIYFVTDQVLERQLKKHQISQPVYKHDRHTNKFDKIYEKNLRDFERAFEKYGFDDDYYDDDFIEMKMPVIRMPEFMTDNVKVKTDIDDNEYKIKIGLKPFQGDENKINYNLTGRKLTVFGNSDVNDNDYHENIAFSQDFILPDNADKTAVQKYKDGHNLIISVPLK